MFQAVFFFFRYSTALWAREKQNNAACEVVVLNSRAHPVSGSPSAFSAADRAIATSWAYLRNGRIRGVPREGFSELISMNEVEQFIFEPALKTR